MKVPTLVELLHSGVHFGHKSSKWHPRMAPYIFTTRKNVHIINLESTQQKLEEALNRVRELASQGKTILFIGTKKQASGIIQTHAEACGMPFVTNRWMGGLLTNFKHVSQVPRRLTQLKQQRETGELKKYTKKEQLEFDREIDRLQLLVGGVETLMRLPDAVFIVDLKEEKTALREARQMNIPIIAMCDTNVDPAKVDFPIPANDDAIKSIELIVSAMAKAADEGRQNPVVPAAPASVSPAAPVVAAPPIVAAKKEEVSVETEEVVVVEPEEAEPKAVGGEDAGEGENEE